MSTMTNKSASLPTLTDKQREVLALVADNRTSKEIAARLGISESAVNQRIEMVRARLGGLPRGELARLYRQEFLGPEPLESDTKNPPWQKIHLPGGAASIHAAAQESIPSLMAGGSHAGQLEEGDGSQLSSYLLGSTPGWLSREDRAMGLARGVAMFAIVVAGMLIAAIITQMLSVGLGG
jgi:DNA-binding CsgD family transcriptional regulator